VDLIREVEQFQFSPPLPHGREGTDQRTQARAVNVMDLCPLLNRSQTTSRRAALSSPSTIRPLMSTIVTPPTCRVLVVMFIGYLPRNSNARRLHPCIRARCATQPSSNPH
jgi:hypothetical protein